MDFAGVDLNSKYHVVLESKRFKIAMVEFTYSTDGTKDEGDEIVNKLK